MESVCLRENTLALPSVKHKRWEKIPNHQRLDNIKSTKKQNCPHVLFLTYIPGLTVKNSLVHDTLFQRKENVLTDALYV